MPKREDDRIRIRIDPELARREFVGERNPAAAFEAARVQPALESLDLEDFGVRIEIPKAAIEKVLGRRIDAAAQVYDTLGGIKKDLVEFFPKVPEILPPFLDATLVNADGTAASLVSVSIPKPDFGDAASNATPWSNPESMTDMRGAFRVKLPPRPVPEQSLNLVVRGSNRTVDLQIKRADLVTTSGSLGTIPLPQTLKPLPRRSIISRLRDVVIPKSEDDVVAHPEDFAEPAPAFSLGEGDCARWFRSNSGVIDRFGFSLLVRLIAPELSGRRLGTRVKVGDRSVLLSSSSTGLTKYLPAADLVDAMTTLGKWELVQRVPVEEPIDVTAFRNVIEANPKSMPKASTLGIGYIVRMHQIWIPTGLSLGDLVYSLPLAPGEQQRIAVAEERETLSVREAEALSAEEQQRYREAADSSTAAVFTSAFNEAASGGSTMKTSSEAGAFGGGLGVGGFFSGIVAGLGIGGGYSDSTSTGSTSSWQKASRDYVSNATQDFHSQLARQASARRNANRTSVRLASAAERREVVSKVISNHNHCHALTMQYWEVLRHFGVSTKVDDVQLVCFVPLEIVQFLPSGQSRTLLSGDYTRDQLLTRYGMLLRYFDVLERRLWWRAEMMHGLKILRTFAGNPKMGVQSSNAPAQEIVNVSFRGTFMPFEDIYVTAVSNTGSRVGPVRMVGASAAIASGIETRAGLIESLRSRRRNTFETRAAGLALPEYIARSDIARLEFSRSSSVFSYRLTLPGALNFTDIVGYLQNTNSLDVTLSPADLEREIGGPLVLDPTATLNGVNLLEFYNGIGGTEQMGAVLPVAAKRLAPLLSYADLFRIEAVFHHVVTNTVTYSRAVWESLTPEERAILLERFTVGVPSGGVIDASQEVPLLNCVANQVLGYFGNCAIMPFFIPVLLAEEMKVTSRDIQEALLKFHRQAFVPPQSSITLPTRGVLGEAILGSCCACEKIDLTRFWNWQDSPGDTAAEPGSLAQLFSGGNQLVGPAGAMAPSQLTTGPMVTINQGPVALTPADLAKTLIEKMPATNLPQNLTGMAELGAQMKVQTQTTADSLNKTISEASGLAKAAMDALPKAMQAKAGTGAGGGAGGAGAGGAGAGGAGAGGAGAGGAGAGGAGAGGAGNGAGGAGGDAGAGGAGGGDVLAAIDGGAAPPIV